LTDHAVEHLAHTAEDRVREHIGIAKRAHLVLAAVCAASELLDLGVGEILGLDAFEKRRRHCVRDRPELAAATVRRPCR
jgi:hypothetical protein